METKREIQIKKLRQFRPHVVYLDVYVRGVFEGPNPEFDYELVRRKDNLVKSDIVVCVAFNNDLTHIGYCVNCFADKFMRKDAYNRATGRFIQAQKHGDMINGPEMFGDFMYRNLSEKVLGFLQREWKF